MGATRHRPSLDALEPRTLLASRAVPLGLVSGPAEGDALAIARDYLGDHGAEFGVAPGDLETMIVSDRYTDVGGAGTTHIYLSQSYNGLPVEGSAIGIHVTPRGEILAVHGGFLPGLAENDPRTPPTPALSAVEALAAITDDLGLAPVGDQPGADEGPGVGRPTKIEAPGIARGPVGASLRYVATAGGPTLAWNLNLVTADLAHLYHADVDAATGELLSVDDLVAHASYNVFAAPKASPDDGPRTVVVDPHLAAPNASPFGWHDTNGVAGAEFTDTRGNNATAEHVADGSRPDGGSGLVFDSPLDLTQAPATYADASITNMFYWANIVHDVLYQYGFTEAAGNFQQNNYGQGGQGGDPMLVLVQEVGLGQGGPRFFPTTDGNQSFIVMTTFEGFPNGLSPARDSALESSIFVHEYAHGLTTRLTGGPSNDATLVDLQSAGMGEGWGDFYATVLTMKTAPTRTSVYPQGVYVTGDFHNGGGVRRFPYSFDMAVNPLTLGKFDVNYDPPGNQVSPDGTEPHNSGEIWAQTLLDMTVLLVEKYGFDPDLYNGNGGNNLALQLVTDALKLQPANPSFLEARDAILQADLALTGGANEVEIWTAFARRGFGLSATTPGSNSSLVQEAFDIPELITVDPSPPNDAIEDEPLVEVAIATFRDPAGSPTSDYSATIAWGDGTSSTGTVVRLTDLTYAILGSTTYEEGGTYNVVVTLSKVGGNDRIATTTLKVADLPILATAIDLNLGWQEVRFDGAVATFEDTDLDPLAADDYDVEIHWGDGVTTPGTVVALAGHNQFEVLGRRDLGGGEYLMTVTITGPGGFEATAGATVVVEDAPFLAAAVPINAEEGLIFSGLVATFVDQDIRPLTASDYSAAIDWGDGPYASEDIGRPIPDRIGRSLVSTLTIDKGDFTIADLDLFLDIKHPRARDLTATLRGPDGTTLILFANPDVDGGGGLDGVLIDDEADPPVDPGAGVGFLGGGPLSVFDGKPLDGTWTLTLTDTGPGLVGRLDGWSLIPKEAGQIVPDGAGGYRVFADHAFALGQGQEALVEIAGPDVTRVTVVSPVVVTNQPLQARAVAISAVEGREFAGVIGQFTDLNPRSQLGDFQAEAVLPDGQVVPVDVVSFGAQQYILVGAFTFTSPAPTNPDGSTGTVPVVVRIREVGMAPGELPTELTVNARVENPPITARPSSFRVTEGTAVTGVIARFHDGNLAATPDSYDVSVDWGGGIPQGGTPAFRVLPDPDGQPGDYVVVVDTPILYRRAGQREVVVTVRDRGPAPGTFGQQVVVTSQGDVTDAPLLLTAADLRGVFAERSPLPGPIVVGRFTDTFPHGEPVALAAAVNWGDGTATPAVVRPVGDPSEGRYEVLAEHTYQDEGIHTLYIVVGSGDGAASAVPVTIDVANRIAPLVGGLDPASDTGVSNTDGITRDATPTIRGTIDGEPDAWVRVFAFPSTGAGGFLAGEGFSDANGAWSAPLVAMPDGAYQLIAVATDREGVPSSEITALTGPGGLVVDTAAPRVASAFYDTRIGAFRVAYDDNGPGMSNSILDPALYSLSLSARGRQLGFGAPTVSRDPADANTAIVRFNTRGLRGGQVTLTIRSSGVTDLAGNALVERYYVDFPGTQPPPGAPFVAQYNLAGRGPLIAPTPVAPASELFGAARFEQLIRDRLLSSRLPRR